MRRAVVANALMHALRLVALLALTHCGDGSDMPAESADDSPSESRPAKVPNKADAGSEDTSAEEREAPPPTTPASTDGGNNGQDGGGIGHDGGNIPDSGPPDSGLAPPAKDPSVAPPASATGIAGTWQGQVVGKSGSPSAASYIFSQTGNWLFVYRDNGQVRQTEISAPGQHFRYLGDGGVYTIEVKSVVKTATSFTIDYTVTWEDSDASAGYQEFTEYMNQFSLQGDALKVDVRFQELDYINGANTKQSGDDSHGTLHRAP